MVHQVSCAMSISPSNEKKEEHLAGRFYDPGRRRYANRRLRPGQAGPARCGMSRLKAGARRIGAMNVHVQPDDLCNRMDLECLLWKGGAGVVHVQQDAGC